MIRWLISPELLSDDEMLTEYREGKCENDRAKMLMAAMSVTCHGA